MVLIYPNWRPKASAVTATILRPTAVTTVILLPTTTSTPNKTGSHQNIVADVMRGPDALLWSLLILWAMLSLIYFIQSRKEMSEEEEVKLAVEERTYFPWLTKNWRTFYGLLAMAYEDKSMYTPIRRECIQSIQQRFKERPQLRMLLEKGIVPLFIQDGGVSTMQTRFWSWSTEFPFIKLAYFEQAKRRACFEFLLPHPKRKRAVRFHKLLGQNNWGYGIQLRACNQVLHKELIGRWSYPAAPYPDVPLSVGAESALEPMLPLLPDKPLDAGRLNTVDGLQWYLKNNESASIPLLHYTDVCIFRVEAGHWGPAELDSFVLACAEKAGMQYRFPVDLMRNQAIKTLERNGLATKVD